MEFQEDEMEAMLREIEESSTPAKPAPTPVKAMAKPEPVVIVDDDMDAEMAAVEEALRQEDAMKAAIKTSMQATIDAATAADAEATAEAERQRDLRAKIIAKEKRDAKKAALAVEAEEVTATAKVVTEEATAAMVAKIDARMMENQESARTKPVHATIEAAPAKPSIVDDFVQARKDVAINPVDLDNAMIEHPGLSLHYGIKTCDARRSYERVKAGLEILEANLDAEYREKLGTAEGKKPTEVSIRNAIVADKRYGGAQGKLIDAQHAWKVCEAVEHSFDSRKDMLLEVARDRRKEKEGALRVMDDSALRERVAGVMGKGSH